MDAIRLYAVGDARHGPVAIDALKAALLAAPDPRRVLVWCDGMSDWAEAATLAELSPGLPPQMPRPRVPVAGRAIRLRSRRSFPPHPPHFPPAHLAQGQAHPGDRDRRPALPAARRSGRQSAAGGLRVAMATAMLEPTLAGLAVLATLGVAIVPSSRSRSRPTGSPTASALACRCCGHWRCSCLASTSSGCLILSSQAQAWCQRHHIEVGFLGPTQASLDRLRRERR